MEDPLYQLAPDGTCLIETLGYRPAEGCRYLDLHLSRPHHSALVIGFAIQMNAICDQLMAVRSDTPLRCRLTLSQAGQVAMKTTPFALGTRSWLVAIAPMRLASDDPWLRYKPPSAGCMTPCGCSAGYFSPASAQHWPMHRADGDTRRDCKLSCDHGGKCAVRGGACSAH